MDDVRTQHIMNWDVDDLGGDGGSKLTVEVRHAGDVTVVTLAGELLVNDGDLAFRRCVHDLLDQGRLRIVVNLAGVVRMDSSGVGMIAAKLQTVRQRGGDMKLVDVTSRSQKVLGLMRLLELFETYEDEAAAITSFG